MSEKGLLFRKIKDKLFKLVVIAFAFLSTVPLLLILFYIFKTGISAINPDFFLHLPKPVGETGGGISNALVGTFMLILLASILAIPLGVISGVYLSERKETKLAWWVKFCVEVLQSVPSIVIGIIAYVWVVKTMGSFSALSGGVALAIMMMPVIVTSTEESLNLVPHSLKEASLALGVPYYKTILKVILPSALTGIVTGVLLGISRIAGETAPLLFTAFGNPFMNTNILKPVNSLPLLIFNYAVSPYEDWHQLAWGAALVLILLVLILNITTRLVTRRWKVQF